MQATIQCSNRARSRFQTLGDVDVHALVCGETTIQEGRTAIKLVGVEPAQGDSEGNHSDRDRRCNGGEYFLVVS